MYHVLSVLYGNKLFNFVVFVILCFFYYGIYKIPDSLVLLGLFIVLFWVYMIGGTILLLLYFTGKR